MEEISLKGVRQNNLKNIDVKIQIGSFTVICGPSGSGKSSLAFGTLFAEGQRRYIESLSNYAKQFIGKAPKPDLDFIENIPPAIAIEQKNSVKNSRSSVGTTTEVVDYLRLFFEKAGVPHCPEGHGPITKDSPFNAAQKVMIHHNKERIYLLYPVDVKNRILDGDKLIKLLLQEGYRKIFIPPAKPAKTKKSLDDWGSQIDLSEDLPSKTVLKKPFYVLIDRLEVTAEAQDRLIDSFTQCYRGFMRVHKNYTSGQAILLTTAGNSETFSEGFNCSTCHFTFPNLSSHAFSFNSPVGACESCKGFGNNLELDIDKIIPNPDASLEDDAVAPLGMPSSRTYRRALIAFCKKQKIPVDESWNALTPEQQKLVWSGDGKFDGIKGYFDYLETKKYKMHVRILLARYKSASVCSTCNGTRLKPIVKHVLVDTFSLNDIYQMTIRNALNSIKNLKLNDFQKEATKEVYKQLLSRLLFLDEIGVHYLTLDRLTKTLSGGEYQRLILAKQLGTGLSDTLYVLDEPTIGLHPRDNDRLIEKLKQLNDLGNTLVVVEHDQDVILNATHVIEMGPESGIMGGKVMFSGTKDNFLKSENSNTTPYLSINKKLIDVGHRPVVKKDYKYFLELKGCTGHNLQNVNLKIPLNRFVTVTGVSGSGKSSLITQTLYPALQKALGQDYKKGLPYKKLSGHNIIKDVVYIDQSSFGKNERSSPATYLKIFDDIREIYAQTNAGRERGYTAGTFSLNVDGGRCPNCKGLGYTVIDMIFMDDIEIPCENCKGQRYRKEILDIKFNGKSIVDVLNMTVAEAMDFFISHPNIRRPLAFLKEVGLQYIQLGQKASSLSGGESQRIKIARELFNTNQKGCLYILDEPTTGLHFKEVHLLIKVLNQLIEAGGSVIVIEHNLEFMNRSDYIIDMGPEAGLEGGVITAQGEPESIIKTKTHTGKYLKAFRAQKYNL